MIWVMLGKMGLLQDRWGGRLWNESRVSVKVRNNRDDYESDNVIKIDKGTHSSFSRQMCCNEIFNVYIKITKNKDDS